MCFGGRAAGKGWRALDWPARHGEAFHGAGANRVIDQQSSLKIDRLRGLFLLLVFYLHMHGGVYVQDASIPPSGYPAISWLSQWVARLAVPGFFMMAGMVMAAKTSSLSCNFQHYFYLLRRRSMHILCPMLAWFFLVTALVALLQLWPQTQVYFSGKNPSMPQQTITEWGLSLLYSTGGTPLGHLWFLRDVFLLGLLWPFWRAMAKKPPILGIIILLLVPLWAAGVEVKPWLYSLDGPLFFLLGWGLHSLPEHTRHRMDHHLLLCVAAFFFLSLMGNALGWQWLLPPAILVGLLACWAAAGEGGPLAPVPCMARDKIFWLYLTHEPSLRGFKKLLLPWAAPQGGLSYGLLYLLLPPVLMLMLYGLACLLQAWARPFYKLMTGYR
jgi:hypothetical protein